MFPFRTLRHLALPLLLASAVTLPAQIVTLSDLPEKPRLEIDTEVENGLQLTWFGREGFSYFLQTTTDLVSEPWQYLPMIETGHDAELEYGLKYSLVIVDGCTSAQTSTLQEQHAREVDSPLLPNCLRFAKSFGPKAAYLGWAWSVNPGAAQLYSSEFLANLRGKRTAKQAFDKLRNTYPETNHVARHYKLYAPVHERIGN